jgi:single-stranded DNA-specific DHH superfamily exonuclease
MRQKLKDYYHRFASSPPTKTDTFFTQLGRDYKTQLPYLPDIEVFCIRLWLSLLRQEKVCIYSDYDTDAVTATGVMYHGLRQMGFEADKVHYYAPDRFTEGYGMNPEAINELALNYDLIVSVDCGINSTTEAQKILDLKASGAAKCDLIITDHHHLHDKVPLALGVINPRLSEVYNQNPDKQPDWSSAVYTMLEKAKNDKLISKADQQRILSWLDKVKRSYLEFTDQPQSFLSSSVTGVGVAWFCLVWLGYFLDEINTGGDLVKINQNKEFQPNQIQLTNLNQLLPLVAIGTVADCQSVLEPTNRLLVKSGLNIMTKGQYDLPGLQELLAQTGLQEKIAQKYQLTSQDLAYLLSPILNSSGRVSHAKLSIGLVCQENKDNRQAQTQAIKDLAGELILTNNQRKQMVKEILEEVEMSSKIQTESGRPMLWLSGDYSKGIVGLLASRLVNQFSLPVVVVAMENGHEATATASLRAPEGFHLPKAMSFAGESLFEKFGGHPGAAGFTANLDNLDTIETELEKSFTAQFNTSQNYRRAYMDPALIPAELSHLAYRPEIILLDSQDLSTKNFELVWQMDPFGQDFPFPQFLFQLPIGFQTKFMGSNGNHARLIFGQELSLVAFNLQPSLIDYLKNETKNKPGNLWVLAKTSQNTFNGNTKTELIAEKLWVVE